MRAFAVCLYVVFLRYLEVNIVEIRVLVNVVNIYYASWHLNLLAILVISGVSCSLSLLTHKIYIIHVICILY